MSSASSYLLVLLFRLTVCWWTWPTARIPEVNPTSRCRLIRRIIETEPKRTEKTSSYKSSTCRVLRTSQLTRYLRPMWRHRVESLQRMCAPEERCIRSSSHSRNQHLCSQLRINSCHKHTSTLILLPIGSRSVPIAIVGLVVTSFCIHVARVDLRSFDAH